MIQKKLWSVLYNIEDCLNYDETKMGKELGELINELQKCNIIITKK